MSKYMKKLWAVCREYGVDSELLHELAETELNICHISECSVQELMYLTDRVQGKNVQRPAPRGMASPAQKGLIKHYAEVLGWDNPNRLNGFIKKMTGCDSIEWLGKKDASIVIEGLKKMLK